MNKIKIIFKQNKNVSQLCRARWCGVESGLWEYAKILLNKSSSLNNVRNILLEF